MGKRKSASKPQGPKKREGLATTFQCLFCNHENSITVKLNKKEGTGELTCKSCDVKFQTGINYLSAAVDVYTDWIDACDAVAKETASGNARAPAREQGIAERRPIAQKEDEYEADGFVENDEVDGEAEYGDE